MSINTQERMKIGVKIARITITMPIVSISPNTVPKTKKDIITEATGSIAAVTEASSGVRYTSPILNSKKAPTVPKIIIQATSKIVSDSKNGSQFISSTSKKVNNPPIIIPTLVKKY